MVFISFALALSILNGLTTASPINLFPTSIGWLGSTATAAAPFLAETNVAAAATGTPTSQYQYPQPIETSVQSFDHKEDDRSIFELMATLSPYYVHEDGWGVYNYATPGQCTIKQVHFLQRHGSRYPDSSFSFPKRLANATFNATGNLEFLNDWELKMGKNILTNLGNNQLFNNGVKGFFRYGQLFDWDNLDEKIVARTTSEQRMMMTAQYYLHGFFGLNWEDYVNLEILIEDDGFNNTLAAWNGCPNNDYAYGHVSYPENDEYKKKYLEKAAERFNSQITGFNFTVADLNEIQTICAYETNILGFSHFCSLFSQEEWEGYEYTTSVDWYAENSFGNSMGRALGVGWVEEFKDRLLNTTYNPQFQAEQNSTLDSNSTFFPLNQTLYMDFTHDSQIQNIITALGFEQFKANWTFEGPDNDTHLFDLSRITPFGAQLAFEIIECDEEVPANRSSTSVPGSGATQYVHAILNDNTLSLSKNIPEFCADRADGWCEFGNFTQYLDTLWDIANYEYACDADYNYNATVTNGAPEV
ncbi:putative acid phosphatase [Saccharomycopsis crataegensis]|uniref:Acid phosphatase n=1 Tax=Saccharomycopsis crataegensis TaxID=43959 RepID=A0AAV5QRV8_9ASCO|nr:putative acid phosphatase [Saccharomycopsis crataegensis]